MGGLITSNSLPDFVIEEFQKGSIQSSVGTLLVNPRATGSRTQSSQMRIVKGGNKKGRMQSAAVGPRKVLALWIQA